MLGSLKWLILFFAIIPIILFGLKIYLARVEKKKDKKFLLKIEKDFANWLENENIIPENFKSLEEKEKIKLFKNFVKNLCEEKTIDYTLPNLNFKIPIMLYRKLKKLKITKRTKLNRPETINGTIG